MKLSVQLYSVRDQCAADFAGTLRALRSMGLRHVELAGLHGRTPEEARRILNGEGLSVSASHVGFERLESDLPAVVAENAALGNDFVVVPWIDKEFYSDGWGPCARRFEPVARALKRAGMRFGYHNHDFELAMENGKPGLQVLFEAADPELVYAQIDTYWVYYGGQDPAAFVRGLAGRVPQVHLKDGHDGDIPRDAEPGSGALDWDSILAACNESEVEMGAIEYDDAPRDPLESVRASVEFFRAKGIED